MRWLSFHMNSSHMEETDPSFQTGDPLSKSKVVFELHMKNVSACAFFENPVLHLRQNICFSFSLVGSTGDGRAQYHLTMHYLCRLTETQTLVLQSAHPAGLFPSPASAPRCVITNGPVRFLPLCLFGI